MKRKGRVLLDLGTEAYHCGGEIKGGEFSLAYVGSGEGLAALGHGIYFATNPNIARVYCKYARRPWFTHVLIDTSGIYDAIWGLPLDLRGVMEEASDFLAQEVGLERLPTGGRLTNGPGAIGEIFRHLGRKRGQEFLRKLGITGSYERLSEETGFEIAVWDTSIIEIISAYPEPLDPEVERRLDEEDRVRNREYVIRVKRSGEVLAIVRGTYEAIETATGGGLDFIASLDLEDEGITEIEGPNGRLLIVEALDV